jgi:hypothetical protein
MEFNQIQIHPDATILYRITSNNKWYIIIWKIGSGIAGIALLVFILFSLLGDPTQSAASSFLPAWLASRLAKSSTWDWFPLRGWLGWQRT